MIKKIIYTSSCVVLFTLIVMNIYTINSWVLGMVIGLILGITLRKTVTLWQKN
jgi:multisubunit Na+/H+ antiporter MnhE subunit